MTKFAESSEDVAEALRAGLPLEAAAEQAGVSPSTIRGWLRKGRRDSEGEFGAFVRSVERDAGDDEAMTVEELERHLTTVIRQKQSVAAMKLWLELHGDGAGNGDDSLLDFVPRSHGGRA